MTCWDSFSLRQFHHRCEDYLCTTLVPYIDIPFRDLGMNFIEVLMTSIQANTRRLATWSLIMALVCLSPKCNLWDSDRIQASNPKPTRRGSFQYTVDFQLLRPSTIGSSTVGHFVCFLLYKKSVIHHKKLSRLWGSNPQPKNSVGISQQLFLPFYVWQFHIIYFLKDIFRNFFIVILLYSFAWPRCNHFFLFLEYKSWQVCVWGKDTAFCLFSLLFLVYALIVIEDIVRDSLLQNNDVDSFAQKYLRWLSQCCNKWPVTNILCW